VSEGLQNKDLSRRIGPFMLMWGIPILILISVNVLEHYLPAAPIILMMAGSYGWMGAGCIFNAWRCSRLHCYISGPAMVIGGALIALVGFDVISLGPVRVMHLSYLTLFVVFLSFLPERILGRYTKGKA